MTIEKDLRLPINFIWQLKDKIKRKEKQLSLDIYMANEDMVKFYNTWKKIGYLTLDGKEILWNYYKDMFKEEPKGKIDCDSCIRETWEAFEKEVIKFINKPQ